MRFALVATGLVILYYTLAGQNFVEVVPGAGLYILGAIVLNQIALQLFAYRMRGVFELFEIRLDVVMSTRIHLQSIFYFFFVPMSVGADLARYYKVMEAVPGVSRVDILAAIVLDRLLGLASALALIVIAGPAILRTMLSWESSVVWWSAALLMVALIAVCAVFGRLPAMHQLRSAVQKVTCQQRRVVELFSVSLLMYAFMGLSLVAGGYALGMAVVPVTAIAGSAASMLGMLVPASFAGVSGAEAAGVGAFLLLGCHISTAITLVSLGYIGRLIGAIEGGIWELLDSGVTVFGWRA